MTPDPPRPPDAALQAERADVEHRIADIAGQLGGQVASPPGSDAEPPHDPEGATSAFERSQLDALLRRAREHLAEIEAAEDRVAAGRYGRCESCGGPIARGRLEARPTAATCLACASASGAARPRRG